MSKKQFIKQVEELHELVNNPNTKLLANKLIMKMFDLTDEEKKWILASDSCVWISVKDKQNDRISYTISTFGITSLVNVLIIHRFKILRSIKFDYYVYFQFQIESDDTNFNNLTIY